jgi:hypothetical protein
MKTHYLRYGVAALVVSWGASGCAGGIDDVPPLPVCATAPSPDVTASDTLHVEVRLVDPSPSEVLVRVDAPGESDIEFPDDASPGLAAAALSVTSRGLYQVCVAESAAAILFQAERAPHGRTWLRVTTRRPVRAMVRVGAGAESSGTEGGDVVVLPGSSGRTGPEAAP